MPAASGAFHRQAMGASIMSSNPRPRYLTKSRFKLAVECPTKLFYTGKTDVYPDRKREDEFLQALAEGGFQVGELAKLMFPGGIEITPRTTTSRSQKPSACCSATTSHCSKPRSATATCSRGWTCCARPARRSSYIEVKAKSFDSSTDRGFRGARGGIDGGMKPYLQDVAFQRHVLGLAYPHNCVSAAS
jgi:hypothetical protein